MYKISHQNFKRLLRKQHIILEDYFFCCTLTCLEVTVLVFVLLALRWSSHWAAAWRWTEHTFWFAHNSYELPTHEFSLKSVHNILRYPVRDYTVGYNHNLIDECNKLCGSRHNMPPPLSSLCGRQRDSRRRADRA